MSQNRVVRPLYAERFRCIGSACDDTCCQGWNVPIDQPSWVKFQAIPVGPLRTLIDQSVTLHHQAVTATEAEPACNPQFAQICMAGTSRCPLLTPDNLCRIQAELGAGMLSHACATYPRILHSVGGLASNSLSLSCPEAARLVLLDPDLLRSSQSHETASDSQPPEATPQHPLAAHFWPIRSVVLALVRNRLYPLWQRLFLLGILSRRLDAIACGELDRDLPEFLRGFEATIATGTLRTAMESVPADNTAQLDLVLRLAGLMLHRSNIYPRFAECIQAFTAGIGNGPGASLQSLAAQYSSAHDRYYEPFSRRHPHIAENYLINTILRCQFPFGRQPLKAEAPSRMAREFALLVAQFALVKGLLIGVSGFHGDAFSTTHVVHTVQAAAKHFEHHPQFLSMAYDLLVESRMDGAQGLAILLRNAKPGASVAMTPTILAPGASLSIPSA